jgi:mono/diheme cytochrome c family protein
VGLALAENSRLEDSTLVLRSILHGNGQMPAWKDTFDDEQIANVATFIRNAWGNDFGEILAQEVAEERP